MQFDSFMSYRQSIFFLSRIKVSIQAQFQVKSPSSGFKFTLICPLREHNRPAATLRVSARMISRRCPLPLVATKIVTEKLYQRVLKKAHEAASRWWK